MIRPDFVEELSWKYGLGDFVMPYTLTAKRLQAEKVSSLEKQLKELQAKQKASEPEEDTNTGLVGLGGRLMIGGPANGSMMMGQPTGMMSQPTGFY